MPSKPRRGAPQALCQSLTRLGFQGHGELNQRVLHLSAGQGLSGAGAGEVLLNPCGIRLQRDQTIGCGIPRLAGLGNGRKGLGRNRAHLAVKGLLFGLWHMLSGPHHGITASRSHFMH